MKGVILAGGIGERLGLLTRVTNKHLLPVYNKPMIYYPLETLIDAGIKEILIVSGPEHAGDFLRLLGSGKEFGVKLSYEIQEKVGGIAHALSVAEDFANGENIAVILGDNIFEDDLSLEINSFKKGAKVFLKEVPDPERFGIAETQGDNIMDIEEKPKHPKSNYAVTGLYIYDSKVFDVIKKIKPSDRGELEITDVNNHFVKNKEMTFSIVRGFWIDTGTFDSLVKASKMIMDMEKGK